MTIYAVTKPMILVCRFKSKMTDPFGPPIEHQRGR